MIGTCLGLAHTIAAIGGRLAGIFAGLWDPKTIVIGAGFVHCTDPALKRKTSGQGIAQANLHGVRIHARAVAKHAFVLAFTVHIIRGRCAGIVGATSTCKESN
jgi:hypothetical protein